MEEYNLFFKIIIAPFFYIESYCLTV